MALTIIISSARAQV